MRLFLPKKIRFREFFMPQFRYKDYYMFNIKGMSRLEQIKQILVNKYSACQEEI